MRRYHYNTKFQNYFIDLYFTKHKLAIEVDERGHKDGDEEKKKKKKEEEREKK